MDGNVQFCPPVSAELFFHSLAECDVFVGSEGYSKGGSADIGLCGGRAAHIKKGTVDEHSRDIMQVQDM